MFRTGYLVPRLVLLLLVCGTLRYGLDPLLQIAAERIGSQVAGAQVDVARVNASLAAGSFYFEDLQITNRADPMTNLVQVGGGWLQISNRDLLEGRLVVPHAVVQGLEFHTPRASSGALVEQDSAGPPNGWLERPRAFAKRAASRRAAVWLEDLERRFAADLRREFQSIPLSEELSARWRAQSEEVTATIAEWKKRITEYSQLIRTARNNPLRHLDLISRKLPEVQRGHEGLVWASQRIGELQEQLKADHAAILAAKEHDVARLQELTHLDDIDPDALSEYLLGESLDAQVRLLLMWVDRGRRALEIGIQGPELNQQAGRGKTYSFGGAKVRTSLLIEELAFSGRVDELLFSGRATGLAADPRAREEPLVVELATSGDIQLRARADMEVTQGDPVFRIVGYCERWPQTRQQFGHADQLLVSVAPGESAIRIDLQLQSDRVSGDIRWQQSEMRLAASIGNGLLALQSTQMGRVFDHVDSLRVHARFEGTIDDPEWTVNSDLGSQLAEGMRSAAEAELQQLVDQVRSRLEQQVRGQLAQRDAAMGANISQLREVVTSMKAIQDLLAERWGLPRGRLGGQSPLGTLLR